MDCEYDWIESKNDLPPLGEVIEGINPKNWLYSNLGRDYFALVHVNDKLIWITPSLNHMEYSELKITHWRRLSPNPKGKKPFIKIKKYKAGYWKPIVIWQYED